MVAGSEEKREKMKKYVGDLEVQEEKVTAIPLGFGLNDPER